METKKIIIVLSLIIFSCLIYGCSESGWLPSSMQSNYAAANRQSNSQLQKRFNETSSDESTEVESAMDLPGKYTTATEQAAKIKQENQQFAAENLKLKERVAYLEKELGRTAKELDEANSILVETRVELNDWKNNILGFRDELRQADTEQLKALIEILKLLGGEIKTVTNQGAANKELVSRANSQQQ